MPFRVFDSLLIDVSGASDVALKCNAYIIWKWIDRSNYSTGGNSCHIKSSVKSAELHISPEFYNAIAS